MTVVAARWDTIEVSSNNESDGMKSIMSGWTWSKTGLVEIKGPGERFSVEQAMASRPSSQAIGAAHAKLEPENIQRDLKEELDEEEKYEDEDGEDEEDSWNEDGSSLSIVEEEESTEGEKKEYESKSKEKMSN